jgi:hypothetical protein
MTEPPNWNDLNRTPPAPREDRIADICARVFITPAGKELLEELRRRYFENGDNPLMAADALRVRAAQQHFVRELERARDRGLAAAVKAKVSPG